MITISFTTWEHFHAKNKFRRNEEPHGFAMRTASAKVSSVWWWKLLKKHTAWMQTCVFSNTNNISYYTEHIIEKQLESIVYKCVLRKSLNDIYIYIYYIYIRYINTRKCTCVYLDYSWNLRPATWGFVAGTCTACISRDSSGEMPNGYWPLS